MDGRPGPSEPMHDDVSVPTPQGWLNVADGIFHNARRRGTHPAIVEGTRTIDYRELALLVRKTAGQLREIGAKPGDIVGVALGDDSDHIISLLAVAWFGAIILPMDVRWTADEKRRVASHFGARFVLVPAGAEVVSGVETVPIDEAWRRGVASDDGMVESVRRRDHPVVLSLSSGTTGTPKGPLVTHGHVLGRLFIYTVSLTFNEADRFMVATPLYFGGGRFMTMAYLFIGATVVLKPPPYTPEELARAVNELGITSLFLVPTLLRRLLEMPKVSAPLFPRLRLLITSGSSLYPEERRNIMRELSPNLFNFYSSTEGGGISVLHPEHPDDASMSVGQVVFGTEVQVVDDQHQPVAAGTVGRIRYRGGSVADSFHRNPEESAAAFRDGWYYPGDLGYFDAKGFLYLAGRSKDMIIRGGVNIYPVEIEQTLITHPSVGDAAVVGWPSHQRGEEVAAFVVRRGDVTERDLFEHCRRSLAAYKLPKRIFFVDELPKSGMGKVLKAKLVERLEQLD
jgi:acyl-CoA synthetase (AMP-forming)/AMP-acid ligase II